jgi:radical SAM superfamily enzyme YgiQ (UPF0313 family)
LVNPGTDPEISAHEPLNLGFLAAYLEKHGHRVAIFDEFAGQNVAAGIHAYRPDLVGITATTSVVPHAINHAKACRAMGIPVVVGGVHASVRPRDMLRHCDMVVVGEGERALLQILSEGITSGVVTADLVRDLDDVPMPARHLMQMEYYLGVTRRIPFNHIHFASRRDRLAGVLFARGCPYACIFCHNSWRGLPVRFHSATRVVAELTHLAERYRTTAVFFMDDDLFASKKRFREMARLLKQANLRLRWGCQARVNSVDEEVLSLAREAGCRQITFGFESGSDRILGLLKNGKTTVAQGRRAIRLCRDAGVAVSGSFMIGNPTETREDIALTERFIHDTSLDGVCLHLTTPFPGTRLWEYCEERKLVPRDIDWSTFTQVKRTIPLCDAIPPDEVERLRWRIILKEVIWRNKLRFAMMTLRGLTTPAKTFSRVGSALRSLLGRRRWAT